MLPFATKVLGKNQLPLSLEEKAALAAKVKKEVAPSPDVFESRLVLKNATPNEAHVVDALYAAGIRDKAAVATVLGNIQQESRFVSNICEGGARVGYRGCRRGGYGLIQWTSAGRYHGLGVHARKKGMDPSSLEAQVSYLFNERQWRIIEPFMKRAGHGIDFYMRKAHRWLGWGIHGNRTHYAHRYYKRLSYQLVAVPHPSNETSNETSN